VGAGDDITLAALESDPDPILARLRADEPVCWVPALDMWLVTRWDDVAAIEADPETFSAATEPSLLRRALGENMLTLDPPACTRLQQIMLPPFQSRGRSGGFAANELASLAERLLDAVEGGSFDVMAAYAQPLSAGSLAAVLGLDAHGFDRMWAWCEGLCADIANLENDPELARLGADAKASLGTAIEARVAAAEVGGPDDAISWFVSHGATTDEIVNNVRLMISGGINEPRDGVGLVTWVLLTRPDLRERALADPRACAASSKRSSASTHRSAPSPAWQRTAPKSAAWRSRTATSCPAC
jgi:cytochrome P450